MQPWLSFLIIFLLRAVGAVMDALSDRTDVDWLTWHAINWLRRDVIILIMYIEQAIIYVRNENRFTKNLDRRFYAVLFFIPFFGVNYLLHQIFYSFGTYLRPYLETIFNLISE